MKLQHVRTIAGFEFYRIMRGPQGILFFSFFILFYGWVSSKLYSVGPDLNDFVSQAIPLTDLTNPAALQNPPAGFDPGKMLAVSFAYELIGWLTGLGASEVDSMMRSFPPVLVLFSFLAVMATPLLALFGSMDQTASDISSRHIRYLLIRTDRTSLYVGKTLGALLVLSMATTVAVLLAGGICIAGGSSIGAVLPYLCRVWVALLFFNLPFITLMGLCNAMTAQSFLALLVAVGYYFVVWAVSSIGSWGFPKLAYLSYLFPTAMKYQMISSTLGDALWAFAHQGVLAAVFFAAGLSLFRWRDV